jgi:LacI family transcriptional regulator
MATRNDVARRAGVSAAVVSYVANHGPRPVAAATAQRVQAAMAELGYRPNPVAKGLKVRTLPVIGALVPDISYPFFGELVRGIEAAAFDRRYLLYLGNTAGQAGREESYARSFIDHLAAGVLVVADRSRSGPPSRVLRLLAGHGIPAAVIDDAAWCPASGKRIEMAHAEAARTATAHLLDHGHASVACLAGPGHLAMTAERLRGWREAHSTRSARPGPVVCCEIDRQAACRAAGRLLAADDRPRALLAATDEQAYGVLQAAAAQHLRIPEDLALAAVDGLAQSACTVPPLTTACLPLAKLGRAAITMILDAGGPPGNPGCPAGEGAGTGVTLPARLAVRSSCGCRPPDVAAQPGQAAVARRASPALPPAS